MTRVELAKEALAGIFRVEQMGGADAYHFGQCLRLVVGAYVTKHLHDVQGGLETDAQAYGFSALTMQDIVGMEYRDQKASA